MAIRVTQRYFDSTFKSIRWGFYMELLKVAAIAAIVSLVALWQVLFLSTAAVAVTTVVVVITAARIQS